MPDGIAFGVGFLGILAWEDGRPVVLYIVG